MNSNETHNQLANPSPNTSTSLPDWCYTVLPSSGALIVVERDINGYGIVHDSTNSPQTNRKLATEYNTRMGVTPQQEAAMLGGSMFGWDAPAASISNYNENGEPIHPDQQIKAAEETAESRFINAPTDAFAIYQLKSGDKTRDLRFEPLSRLKKAGITVDHANYELIYTAPLQTESQDAPFNLLHRIFEQFNIDHPADYAGHSLSVSDVVALKLNGQITSHYVDSWSFVELPTFLPPDNPLKNAEMAMEDDYGMLDGIINNGKSPAAKENEKPSLLEQLKTKYDQQTNHQPAQHKNTERGMDR